jgi:hypothetical protein
MLVGNLIGDVMLFRFPSSAVSLALATFVCLSNGAGAALAQGPMPSYGEPSPSPLIDGYETRLFRTFQLNVPLFVPLEELQRILPGGFSAIANPSESQTAAIALSLVFHQHNERLGGATGLEFDGPVSTLAITSTVRNVQLNRNEAVVLANEQNNAESVLNANAFFGDGAVRLAHVKADIEEKNESLKFRFDVADDDIGLELVVVAVGPAAMTGRVVLGPGTPNRALSGQSARRSYRSASQYDNIAVTITPSNLRVRAPHDTLHLPGGDLTIVGLGAAMTFQHWREQLLKLEPGQ